MENSTALFVAKNDLSALGIGSFCLKTCQKGPKGRGKFVDVNQSLCGACA